MQVAWLLPAPQPSDRPLRLDRYSLAFLLAGPPDLANRLPLDLLLDIFDLAAVPVELVAHLLPIDVFLGLGERRVHLFERLGRVGRDKGERLDFGIGPVSAVVFAIDDPAENVAMRRNCGSAVSSRLLSTEHRRLEELGKR